jgi:hypothetical protein
MHNARGIAPIEQPDGPSDEGRTPAPLVLVDELAKLTANAASDVNHIVGLTDPIERPTEIKVFMAHETARDARDTLHTMLVLVDRLLKRESHAADVADAVTGATLGEAI